MNSVADALAVFDGYQRGGMTLIALRACITSHRTQPADIDILVAELERAVAAQ
jgi:hypothetical protein